MVVTEAAGLGRTAASPGNLVPSVRQRNPRLAGHGIDVEHRWSLEVR
jgi:hypothetical protein